MKTIIKLSLIALTLVSSHLYGQQAFLISDLYEGPSSGASSKANTSIVFNDKVYFSGNDGEHGFELMVYDKNTISLVADIKEGAGSSDIQNFYILGDKMIFTANDGVHGSEFWISDGTTEGTELLIDLSEGDDDGVYPGFGESNISFGLWDGYLYFNGRDRPNDNELWRTDGTPEGTTLIKNISRDQGTFITGSWPKEFVVYEDNLYFSSRNGFWKTNGTTAGTVLVLDENPNDPFGFTPDHILATDFGMFMVENDDLWVSDGTTSGTMRIKEFEHTSTNWSGPRFRDLGEFVLFPANDGVTGNELWRSDGTPGGTQLVLDLIPGPDGYAPQNTVVFNGKMYYKGSSVQTGIELFESDGTAAGTKLVYEFNPGTSSGFFLPTTIFTDGTRLYMSAGESFNQQLWVSDGTSAGTYEIEINPSGDSYPTNFLPFGENVFFTAIGDGIGREPYLFDAVVNTVQPTQQNISIYPNPAHDIFYVDMPTSSNYQISITDMLGRTLMTTKDAAPGIDIRELPAALYALIITDTQNTTIGTAHFFKK